MFMGRQPDINVLCIVRSTIRRTQPRVLFQQNISFSGRFRHEGTVVMAQAMPFRFAFRRGEDIQVFAALKGIFLDFTVRWDADPRQVRAVHEGARADFHAAVRDVDRAGRDALKGVLFNPGDVPGQDEVLRAEFDLLPRRRQGRVPPDGGVNRNVRRRQYPGIRGRPAADDPESLRKRHRDHCLLPVSPRNGNPWSLRNFRRAEKRRRGQRI